MERTDERELLCDLVGCGRVLDCGCGGGENARRLRARGCEVVGIELDPQRARSARAACLAVLEADLEDPGLPARARAHGPYDALVLCHVLEHLRDPAPVVRRLLPLLRPGGRAVVVLPNVAQWRMRARLLRGRWDYADEGILDRTHVRFYTLASAREALRACGLAIEEERVPRVHPGPGLSGLPGRLLRWLAPPTLTADAFVFACRPLGD